MNNNLNIKENLVVLDQALVIISCAIPSRVIDNTFCYDLNHGDTLREVIVKIGLERIDTQKEVMVKVLLDSGVMRLVISSEFARKQEFKLKKIERLIYI